MEPTAPPAWAVRMSLVSVFAMLGVLSRLYIGQAFLSAGVTGLYSALFIDLPANVAGSFLLGVASNGATVGHGRITKPGAEYAWGILPQRHAWNRLQVFLEINFAFRTGYCGSFTTVPCPCHMWNCRSDECPRRLLSTRLDDGTAVWTLTPDHTYARLALCLHALGFTRGRASLRAGICR